MEQELENKLSKILQLANEFKTYYATNEIAVREQLINPILNILGWDTSNPNYVRHNAPNEFGKIPDYTLIKNKKNVLVVEAKNLTVELKDDKIISQLAGYSYNMGISFGILTNGIKWLLFNTFQRNPNERIVWIADLEKTENEISNIIKKLVTVSYENIEKLESSIQRIKVLESVWTSLCPNPEELIKLISYSVKEKAKKENPSITMEISDIETFVESKITELFDVNLPEKENIVKITEDTNNGNDVIKPKKPKTVIKVTFPDKTVYCESKSSETFAKTIEKIGIDKVKPLNLTMNGIALIDTKKNSKYQQYETSKGFFIMVHSDTNNKIIRLREISNSLKLNLAIETIKWKPNI